MNTKSPHLDPVWLRQKYEAEGLSTYDIAAIVGRDPKRVYEKLIDFGIPTRPRGMNLKGDDCYMKRGNAVNPFQGKKHTAETRAALSRKASVPRPHLRGEANGMSGRTGETNPNYRGGGSPERQSLYASGDFKAILRYVFARDGYRCQRCGSPKKGKRGIHGHHIKGWAEHPESRFDPNNIVTLCRKCHEWVHSVANTERQWIA